MTERSVLSTVQRWNDFQEADDSGYWVSAIDYNASIASLESAIQAMGRELREWRNGSLARQPVLSATGGGTPQYYVSGRIDLFAAVNANPIASAAVNDKESQA